jgi:two-component system KDP operon response regulator KdpE
LLLIDDDVLLCEAVQLVLTEKGFQVEVAHDAMSGLQKAYANAPDLVILDIMLPDLDGWQTCRRFREMTDVPIILLTALSSEENVVQGLNLGADDYIIKPVTSEELAARVRAALRRVARWRANGNNGLEPVLTIDSLEIDFDKHEATVDGRRVNLSPTEFRLLSVLCRHRGRVLTHAFLLTEVWGPEYIGEIDYLRLYISYLRRKLNQGSATASLIHNEWGVGYRLG